MSILILIAGVCGLVEGLAGLVGTLFIYLCVDYPKLLSDHPGIQLSKLNEMNGTIGEKRDLRPVAIMASGYSSDPDREIIFCFSILSSTFGAIWILSSICIFIGSRLKNSRLLWFWVLSTMAVVFLDFVGAIFFANKTGGYIMFFEDTQQSKYSDSTMLFLKYKYPIILLIVFGRGIITVPVNLFLTVFVHRKAQSYYSMERKSMVLPQPVVAHSPMFSYPVKNGFVESGPSNGSSSSAVYTNESFTSDEKF